MTIIKGLFRQHGLLLAITIGVIFFHLYRIADLPTGFYLDETSIGLNAALMAKTGKDEHGEPWPLYFKAFGENKNPTYIYAAAALFRAFGTSEWTLRFTSFVFFIAGYGLFFLLARRLWGKNRLLLAWALIGYGTLPYFFTISRISFEVISQLTWITLITLIAHHLCKAIDRKLLLWCSFAAGLAVGTSIYTYSTARLLSLITLITFFLCLVDYEQVKGKRVLLLKMEHLLAVCILFGSFLICIAPYLYFTLRHPGGVTGRFLAISFLDDPIPLTEKLGHLSLNYLSYWSPHFLLFRGEGNFRHAIGYAGAIYMSIYIFGLLALVVWLKNRLFMRDKFIRFLLLSWLAAPLAAATINEAHVLRSMTFGLYWLIASGYGLRYALTILKPAHIKAATRVVVCVLALEAVLYLLAYFVIFPERSIHGSESYDVKSAYIKALDLRPEKIWFFADPQASYTNMEFRFHTVSNPHDVPVEITSSKFVKVGAGECVIYPHWAENRIRSAAAVRFREAKTLTPNFLQRMLKIPPKDHITRVRCY